MDANAPGENLGLSEKADATVKSSIYKSEECCTRTKPKREPWYNQPLPVGLLILLVTFLLQEWGWKTQQKFITEQTNKSAAIAQTQGTIEEVTNSVGRLLSASAIIVGAHEAKLKKPEVNEGVDRYNALQAEWDQNVSVLKLKIRDYFKRADVELAWSSLLDRLGDLDSEIMDLHSFSTGDPSESHSDQIRVCRATLTELEERLANMTALMTDHLKSLQANAQS